MFAVVFAGRGRTWRELAVLEGVGWAQERRARRDPRSLETGALLGWRFPPVTYGRSSQAAVHRVAFRGTIVLGRYWPKVRFPLSDRRPPRCAPLAARRDDSAYLGRLAPSRVRFLGETQPLFCHSATRARSGTPRAGPPDAGLAHHHVPYAVRRSERSPGHATAGLGAQPAANVARASTTKQGRVPRVCPGPVKRHVTHAPARGP